MSGRELEEVTEGVWGSESGSWGSEEKSKL